MTFRIERRTEYMESIFGVRYMVEKVLEDGDAYLVATFKDEGTAMAMLTLLAASTEVEDGSHVTYGKWTT